MKIHTKRRKANNNEPWIGELLDEVSEDKLLENECDPDGYSVTASKSGKISPNGYR